MRLWSENLERGSRLYIRITGLSNIESNGTREDTIQSRAVALGSLAKTSDLFLQLLDMTTYPPRKGSLESHLFARARKTVSWFDDSSQAASTITDKDSLLDWKVIAICETLGGEELASVPLACRDGDWIVLFKGARVPFIVRSIPFQRPLHDWVENVPTFAQSKAVDEFQQCEIIGECLVNRYQDVKCSFEDLEEMEETFFVIV